MDDLTPEQRRYTMSRVRAKDTGPEMKVRRLTHRLGFRFRLHRRDLPGAPDLVFPARRKVIFVHGCFWHGHECPAGANRPASNRTYWTAKLQKNITRDKANLKKLSELGWETLILWECEIRDEEALGRRIARFLSGSGKGKGRGRGRGREK